MDAMADDDVMTDRGFVRLYSLIPRLMFRLFPTSSIKRMYDKAMKEAVVDYGDLMGGVAVDFDDIARATVRIETEVVRRKLDRKPLNPHNPVPPVYATEVWARHLHRQQPQPHF